VSKPQHTNWRILTQLAFFVLLLSAGIGLILASELLFLSRVSVEDGQAASEDIHAPQGITFVSEIKTEEARKRALAAVQEVYEPLDRQVGREQIRLAQQILDFVSAVRSDPYAEPEHQQYALASVEQVTLSAGVISDTLQLPDPEWSKVQQETRRVLAAAMSQEIKTGQEDAHRLAVRSKIDFELSEPQTAIVNEVASALIRANRVANPEATEAARQAAIAGVPSQTRSLIENQTIVRSGELVDAEDIEALAALGLLHPQIDWFTASGYLSFALVLALSTSAYLWYSEPALIRKAHHLLLLLLLLVAFVGLAKWGATLERPQPYLIPLAALGMLVTVLFDVRTGLVAQLVLAVAIAFSTPGELEPVLYHLAGGLIGLFSVRRIKRINTFVWSGVYVMFANIAMVLTFMLLGGAIEPQLLGRRALAAVVNGGLSAILTLGGYSLLGTLFNIMTTLQLLDLSRPTHPLLRQLLLKAPGTYHHSIMVGNMAEQAAEVIEANALLARVGAFYHDIGKTIRPYFFTENQTEIPNPHNLLDPETSAQIIRSHVTDGLELARKYHLPRGLRAFISEHHGTARISYFYHKACQEYGEDNIVCADYEHQGTPPQSKETAIVMLADTCEAAVRSIRPSDDDELEALIRDLVAKKIASGQLDNAPLTLHEIDQVAASFANTLQGVFHPRVSYPSDSSSQAQEDQDQPTLEETTSESDRDRAAPALPASPEHTKIVPETDGISTLDAVETDPQVAQSPEPAPFRQGAPIDGGRSDPSSL
jgi:putative nucleotidyltransferase with HDIG domain